MYFAILSALLPLYGSDGADTPDYEETVVITASPIIDDTEITREAQKITRVSAEQIADLNAKDLADALRLVPGIVLSRYNLVGCYGGADGGAVYIRGHGSGRPGAQIALFVDGIPRFVGIWSHPLLDMTSADSAQSITIYSSPQPVLLGNMAFGAVNIEPREPVSSGLHGSLLLGYGSYDTLRQGLSLAYKTKDLSVHLGQTYKQSDGHRENADGRVFNMDGSLAYAVSDKWRISCLFNYGDSRAADPGIINQPLPENQWFATDSLMGQVKLAHYHTWGHGFIQFYYEDGYIDWQQYDADEAELFHSVSDYQNYGVHMRETFAPWQKSRLLLGFDYDVYGGTFDEIHPDSRFSQPSTRFRDTSPYVMFSQEWDLGLVLVPSVGIRYNHSNFFADEWSGQAGLMARYRNGAVYANVSRAYNLPGVYAAVNYAMWGQGEAWQELSPELIKHVELGWRHTFGRKHTLTLSLFRDQVRDGLKFTAPPPHFENIGAYTIQGVEANLRVFPWAHTALFVGGTLSRTDPDDTPNAPEATVAAGVHWRPVMGLDVHLDGEYVSAQYVLNPRYASSQKRIDAYFLLNGRLGYDLALLGTQAEVFVALDNIGDADYAYRPGYPMPGRTLHAGVHWTF